MKRFGIALLALTSVAGLMVGCATPQIHAAEIGLASLETTPVAFASAQATDCPELLTCVEREDAPLPRPTVRTTSSGTSSSSSDSSDEIIYAASEERRAAARELLDAAIAEEQARIDAMFP